MAGTGYTAHLHPDWQSGLCIDGVTQPMRNNGDDPASAPRRGLERSQHAGMIGARILADHKDCVGQLEIAERHRAFATSDGLAQANAARFVAHIGAIRQVVGAELAHEQLV